MLNINVLVFLAIKALTLCAVLCAPGSQHPAPWLEADSCHPSLLPPHKSLLLSHKSPRGKRESHIDGSRDKAAENIVLQGSS